MAALSQNGALVISFHKLVVKFLLSFLVGSLLLQERRVNLPAVFVCFFVGSLLKEGVIPAVLKLHINHGGHYKFRDDYGPITSRDRDKKMVNMPGQPQKHFIAHWDDRPCATVALKYPTCPNRRRGPSGWPTACH